MIIGLATSEWLTLASLLLGGGFVLSLIAIYKAKPERDSVVVSSAQNAATILQGLNDALYSDLNRTRLDRDMHERRADAYEECLREAGIPVPHVPTVSADETSKE